MIEHPVSPATPFDLRIWRLAIVACFSAVTIGAAVLTAIFAVNPARFVPYTFSSAASFWAALAGTAFYCAMIALALRDHRHAFAAISAAAFVRVAAFASWGPIGYPGTADPIANVNIAANIIAGHGIILNNIEVFLPTVFKALYPPFYPLLLAVSSFFIGQNPTAVFVLNSGVDAAAGYTIFLIGREIATRNAGIAAAALYLLWPTSILLSLTAQKETTAVLLAMQCVLAFVRLRSTTRWQECIRLSLATALLALTQPSWLPFVACLGVFFLPTIGFSRTVGIAFRSIPIFVAFMLPWWIRNYLVFDRFVPLTTSYGINLLYVASNRFDALATYFRAPGATEIGGAALGWEIAWEIISNDPLRYLKTRFIDVTYAWGLNTFPADLLRGNTPPYQSDMRLYYGLQISHLAVLGLATVGFYRSGWRCRWLIVICLATFAHFALFQAWFEFSQRHRYLLMPILFLVTAQGLRYRDAAETKAVES